MRSADGSACHQVPYAPGQRERALPARAEELSRLGRVGHHRQVQPESAADPIRHSQKGIPLLLVGQPVGAHQVGGLFGQHAHPVERSARQQHPREPQIVVGRRPQARAATAEGGSVIGAGPIESWCNVLSAPSWYIVAARRRPAGPTLKPVSDMPSGSKMRSDNTSASGLPSIRDNAMPRRRWRGCRSIARRADAPAEARPDRSASRPGPDGATAFRTRGPGRRAPRTHRPARCGGSSGRRT